jgi:hypothetical protein
MIKSDNRSILEILIVKIIIFLSLLGLPFSMARAEDYLEASSYGITPNSSAGSNSSNLVTALGEATATGGPRPIHFGCGTFQFSSPIILNVVATGRVSFVGQGLCTILKYTGTTGTFITYNSTGGNTPGYGLYSLRIAGSGGSTVGLQIGDPSSGANTQSQSLSVHEVRIDGFGVGVKYGSGAWITSFTNSFIAGNTQNLIYPSGLTNSGEELNFTNTSFADGGQFSDCVSIQGPVENINFKGGSFDNCQVVINSSSAHAVFLANHFESPGASLPSSFVVVQSGKLTIRDANVILTSNSSGATSALFSAQGASTFVLDGLNFGNNTGVIYPSVVALSGSATLYEKGTHYIDGNPVSTFVTVSNYNRVFTTTPPNPLNALSLYAEDPMGERNLGGGDSARWFFDGWRNATPACSL